MCFGTGLVWLTVVALAAVSIAGCTGVREYVDNGFKVGPNYRRPAAPVAEQWIDADDRRIRSQTEDDSVWWTVFNDPAMNAFVLDAYQQNLTLREAGFRVLEARASRDFAVGNLFPQQQQAVGSYTRNKISNNVKNSALSPEKWFSLWDGGFTLAWELDFWGRFRRAIEAADGELNASVENYDDVLVSLISDVATAYIQIRTQQERIELARQNVELQRESLSIAKARFDGGQTNEIDVDQARSILAQTEATIPVLEIQLRQANDQLCTLLGIPPRDLAKELGPGLIPTPPLDVAVGIPADLLRRRPDVRRSERQLAAQSARIGVAVSDLYPHISITGSIGLQANQLHDLFGPGASTGAIGPGLTWDVLNYGRLMSNIRIEDARFQQFLSRYQNTVLQANQDVEDGLVAFLRSQQQAQYLAISVDAAVKAVKVANARYRAGLEDYNRVAFLESSLVQQQDLLAQSRGNIALGLIQVYRALGGGWQLRCNPEGIAAEEAPGKPPAGG